VTGPLQFKTNLRPSLKQPGWSLYVGRADGMPAAAAALYLHKGAGYLADAATHPAFRGQGFQSALLRRRRRGPPATWRASEHAGAVRPVRADAGLTAVQDFARPCAFFLVTVFAGPQMISIAASATTSSAGRSIPARA
jgi:GNAT superfamily N-acetyltransferase